jgi:hypothetical protein
VAWDRAFWLLGIRIVEGHALETKMEDRVERARLRFNGLLANAETAFDEASREHPPGLQLSSAMVLAMKYMNRAGGFLEAVGIVLPDLGAELIDEFEAFAAKIEELQAAQGDGDRRGFSARRARSDRRGWDRRLGHDRRRLSLEVIADRRHGVERRAEVDRRTGKIRELADRRLRALHR